MYKWTHGLRPQLIILYIYAIIYTEVNNNKLRDKLDQLVNRQMESEIIISPNELQTKYCPSINTRYIFNDANYITDMSVLVGAVHIWRK